MLRASAICLLLTLATPLHADVVGVSNEWRLSVGPVAGRLAFDQALANYNWDTRSAMVSGLQTTLYRGRFAAGARVWRSHTTQASGIPGESRSPRVNLTGVELLGQVRAVEYMGLELWGSAHGGRLHLGYDPDQLEFDTGGVGGTIVVDYVPIDEWTLGWGVELRTEITRQLAVSVQADQSTFALDTAHRRGTEIVESRERFYNWMLRFQVSWLLNLG